VRHDAPDVFGAALPNHRLTTDPGLICHSAVFSLHLISLSHTTVHWLIFGVAADDSFRGLG
jgi:hypothetical protein